MNAPDWRKAKVDSSKLIDYLQSMTHPRGRSKAIFFLKLGYGLENWRSLAEALQTHALNGKASLIEETEYGALFKVEGEIKSAVKAANIRSVWLVDWGSDVPRFITAYPMKGKGK